MKVNKPEDAPRKKKVLSKVVAEASLDQYSRATVSLSSISSSLSSVSSPLSSVSSCCPRRLQAEKLLGVSSPKSKVGSRSVCRGSYVVLAAIASIIVIAIINIFQSSLSSASELLLHATKQSRHPYIHTTTRARAHTHTHTHTHTCFAAWYKRPRIWAASLEIYFDDCELSVRACLVMCIDGINVWSSQCIGDALLFLSVYAPVVHVCKREGRAVCCDMVIVFG